jgi:hypothetical protein
MNRDLSVLYIKMYGRYKYVRSFRINPPSLSGSSETSAHIKDTMRRHIPKTVTFLSTTGGLRVYFSILVWSHVWETVALTAVRKYSVNDSLPVFWLLVLDTRLNHISFALIFEGWYIRNVNLCRYSTGKVHPRTGHEGPEDYRKNSTLPLTSALDRGGWSTPRPGRFTPGKDSVPTVLEAMWTPKSFWTGAEYLAPTGIRSPDRQPRSESLYRLRFPGSLDRM